MQHESTHPLRTIATKLAANMAAAGGLVGAAVYAPDLLLQLIRF